MKRKLKKKVVKKKVAKKRVAKKETLWTTLSRGWSNLMSAVLP